MVFLSLTYVVSNKIEFRRKKSSLNMEKRKKNCQTAIDIYDQNRDNGGKTFK